MFALSASLGHVGYISLDATFFIYSSKGSVIFSAFEEEAPR
jgi:hypothetical protein